MSRQISDPVRAVCGFLAANVGDLLASNRDGSPAVFRNDLPKGETGGMPKAVIVVRRAGGGTMFGTGMMGLFDPRLDVVCYGTNPTQAEQVADQAVDALRLLSMEAWEDVMLYSARISGGPVPSYHTQAMWPLYIFSVQLLHRTVPETLGAA